MLASLSVTAFAAEINQGANPKTANFQVTTSIAPTYTVKVDASDTAITSGATVAVFNASTAAQSVALHFNAENPTYAGDYSDTVTKNIVKGMSPVQYRTHSHTI